MKNITLAVLIAMAASTAFASGEAKQPADSTVTETTEQKTTTVTTEPTDVK